MAIAFALQSSRLRFSSCEVDFASTDGLQLRYFLLTNYVPIPVAWRLRDGGRHSRFAKSPGRRPAPTSFAEAGLSSLSLRTRGVSPLLEPKVCYL